MKPKFPVVLMLVLLAQVLALPALASCANPFHCMCGVAGHVVIQAKVLDDTVGHGVVEIEAIDNPEGVALGLSIGATASSALDASVSGVAFKLGDHFLGTLQQPSPISPIVRIDTDGRVTCFMKPSFRPTVAQARAIMSSPDCPAAMNAAGFGAPPCNDTVSPNASACSAAPGTGGDEVWLGFLLAAFGVAGFWRWRAAKRCG